MGGRQSADSRGTREEGNVTVDRTRSSTTTTNARLSSRPMPRAQPIVLPTSSRVNRFERHRSLPSRNPSSHHSVAFPMIYGLRISSHSSDSGLAESLETRSGLDLMVSGTSSLPTYYTDIKCPICSKKMAHDQIEQHMVVCLSKPIIVYNEDKAMSNLGECIICFYDMDQGSNIARLPCLCVYHKMCIDKWFGVNRCCPKHPEGFFS